MLACSLFLCAHNNNNNNTLLLVLQEELNMSKDQFRERFNEVPRKDDLTILVPRIDDPTEQVGVVGALDQFHGP
jgi:hypothetical protein